MPIMRILAPRVASLAAVSAVALTIASLHVTTAGGQAPARASDVASPNEPAEADIAGIPDPGARGIVAEYCLGTQIVPPDAESGACPSLIARATRFSRASEATRYIGAFVANLIDNPAPYDQIEQIPVDDLPAYGDATSGFSYRYSVPDLGPSAGVSILFQQDRVVYELEFEGIDRPDFAVIDAVVQDVLDCAQEG